MLAGIIKELQKVCPWMLTTWFRRSLMIRRGQMHIHEQHSAKPYSLSMMICIQAGDCSPWIG